MTDITKALRELPPWQPIGITGALAARLALAERLLQENSQLVTGEWQCAKDARAYLQFRAKEQP